MFSLLHINAIQSLSKSMSRKTTSNMFTKHPVSRHLHNLESALCKTSEHGVVMSGGLASLSWSICATCKRSGGGLASSRQRLIASWLGLTGPHIAGGGATECQEYRWAPRFTCKCLKWCENLITLTSHLGMQGSLSHLETPAGLCDTSLIICILWSITFHNALSNS